MVNLGVSFLHLSVTEKTEKPIDEVIPKTKPIKEFFSVLPKAIIPTDLYGQSVDLERLEALAEKYGVALVVDSAESLGAEYSSGRKAGSGGDIAILSFNGNKIITSGGGGCITTQNKDLYQRAKHITTTAKISKGYEYIHDQIGYNFRMPNINAALGCAQLETFQNTIDNKKKLYQFYSEQLPLIGLELATIPKDTSWNYWLMPIILENKTDRDLFLKETNRNKIMTRPVWRLLFKLPMFNNCQKDSQKNARLLESTIVNIPSNVRIK